MELFEVLGTLGLALWSVLHILYLVLHFVVGPLAAFIIWDKGYAHGVRGFCIAAWAFILGPVGLAWACLLRTWPGHNEAAFPYPAAWSGV